MSEVPDFIVVGSGCTGAVAAHTLVKGGAKVLMLDAGIQGNEKGLQPGRDFRFLRCTDTNSADYLLGDDLNSFPDEEPGTGAQLSPPRMHMVKRVRELLPLVSSTFFPMESLAYGGLGAGWGLGSCVFSDEELKMCGLPAEKMRSSYQSVADLIGISGENDDAGKYTCGNLNGLMPPAEPDNNAKGILEAYKKVKTKLNSSGFFLGRPSLALLTRDREERKAYAYRDLDFYSDADRSAWRPWMTVESLKRDARFSYRPGCLVTHFSEYPEGVKVHYRNIESGREEEITCRKLLLSPGTLGTARIVLRSFEGEGVTLPLICNPYYYIPSIQWRMIGKGLGERPVGFAQLSLFEDPDGSNSDVAMASIYSYHSLMLFRLIRQAPLDMRTSAFVFKNLLPALSVFGIHHPEKSGNGKFTMKNGFFSADYSPSSGDCRKRNRRFLKAIRKLGCFPVKVIDPGAGSSIHYAGTLPFSEGEKRFTLHPTGRLNGTGRVYVSDGSGFRYLPAKGLTLSLMAWSHHVSSSMLRS